MKLKKLHLTNFRGFEKFETQFHENTTVIIGRNGAGKTSILDAIALGMLHYTNALMTTRNISTDSARFSDADITTGKSKSTCALSLNHAVINAGSDFTVRIEKSRTITRASSTITPEDSLKTIKNRIKNETLISVPIVAYFNVNRTAPAKTNQNKSQPKDLVATYKDSLSLRNPTFHTFVNWYINQVNRENSIKIKKGDLNVEIESLANIRSALKVFLSNIEPSTYGDIIVHTEENQTNNFDYVPKQSLVIFKDENEFSLDQLSDGERMIITLVAEIARRLVIANKENPLQGVGVVLIDEIELHLHPSWQRLVVKALEKTFPNLSFIFTTHSPLILSSLRRKSIKVVRNYLEVPTDELPDIYTATSDEILEKLMLAHDSYNPYEEELKEVDKLFNDMKIDEAHAKLQDIKSKLNSQPVWLTDYEMRLEFARQ